MKKLCPRCRERESPRTTNPKAHAFCLPCLKEYRHEHYLANKDRYAANAKAYRKAHPETVRASNVAATQRWREKKGKEFLKLDAIKQRYGVTPEQYRQMEREQDGCCAICHRRRKLHLDHDHETNEARGLTCGQCNRALGLMQDDPERLEAAARYLRRPKLKLVV